VRACAARPRQAGELATLVGLAPASVSEHLKVLRKTGILVLESRHRFRIYRTDGAALRGIADAVAGLAAG
jgi:DNA-binding transcriptional ArsR family regulator